MSKQIPYQCYSLEFGVPAQMPYIMFIGIGLMTYCDLFLLILIFMPLAEELSMSVTVIWKNMENGIV